MVRILHVYPQLNNAGTEMVIMNLYRNINRDKVQFDFLVQKKGELDDIVRSLGAKIYYIEKSRQYSKLLCVFYREHPEYKVIHTHTHKEMGIVLKMAAKVGVPYRIAHSHNYRGDVPKFMKYYKMISGWNIEKYATNFCACSQEAAKWLFPRKFKQCKVWKNAIELERFIYNENVRREYRKQLDIPQDAKVICHVGRFTEQKNHRRIISLLNQLMKKDTNIYALLVGVGPLMDEIKSMEDCERILFLGNRTDVPEILNAADLFLFPSLYEGLGIVAIEAQASGIQCIASTNVPKEANLGTGRFEQIALHEDDNVWLRTIEEELRVARNKNRLDMSKKSLETSYNIKTVASMVEEFYLSLEYEDI